MKLGEAIRIAGDHQRDLERLGRDLRVDIKSPHIGCVKTSDLDRQIDDTESAAEAICVVLAKLLEELSREAG